MPRELSVSDMGATGDGVTDDTAAVQAAISAAVSIRFPAGTYLLSAPIKVPSNRRLFGDGNKSVLKKDTRHVGRVIQNDNVTGNHNIVIEHLSIDGGATIDSFRPLEDGIYLTKCQGCSIRFVSVSRCQNDGIIIEYGDENIVENCLVYRNAKIGIYLSGTSVAHVSRNVCIENNVGGIAVAATKNASILENVCNQNKLYGIVCGRDAFNCLVMGNDVIGSLYAFCGVPEPLGGNTLHGIRYDDRERLYGMRHLRIAHNRFGGKVAMIMATDTQFEKNTCFNSNSQGLLLQGSSGNIVRDNDVEHWNTGFPAGQLASLGTTDGIPLSMQPPLPSDNNKFIGNRFRSSAGAGASIVDGGSGNELRENIFSY